MEKEMEKGKIFILVVLQIMKENIKMEKEMEKEKNIILIENY